MNKDFRIIALDMDGTLLNSRKEVPQENLEVLRCLMDKGHIVCISTGRALPGVEKFIDIIKPNGPIITNNGAILVNPGICDIMSSGEGAGRTSNGICYRKYDRKNARVLSETGLEYEDAVKVLSWGELHDVTMIIWCKFELFGNRMDERLVDYGKRFGGSTPRLYYEAEEKNEEGQDKINISEKQDIAENKRFTYEYIEKKYAGVLAKGITKILWYASEERISELTPLVDESLLHSVTKCTSDPDFLEFFNKKVSKAIVLQKICEIYGTQPQKVIAMGDGTNDISMLQFAGLGIAMKNAPDNVKQAADSISEYNNDDSGVARELVKLGLSTLK